MAAVLGVCLLFLTALHCVNQIKLRRQWRSALRIKKGMIVSIGIGQYGPKPRDAEATGHFSNLPVGADVENMRKLADYLHYPFIIEEGKLSWTKDEVMAFIEDKVCAQFFDENGLAKYDGLIVAISSHGMHDCIISSDYKMINRTDIHRCISDKYPQIRVIPRIFLFDACDGTRTRKEAVEQEEEDSDTKDDVELEEADKGPHDGVVEVQMETEWTSKTKNPDYNLVVVHGSNDGFVSKMQKSEVGSYLTYCFTKMIKERIEKNQRKVLSEILVEIQDALHDTGKQMIKFICFNQTGSLRIERGARVPMSDTPALE